MSDYGITRRFTRAKLPIQILIGNYLNEPGKLTFVAPPLDIEGALVPIKSGMMIVLAAGNVGGVAATGFRNAVAADNDSLTQSVYVAVTDADAHDVQQSGKLVGLDCSDTFVIQTGYFAPDTYIVDDPLTVGAGGILQRAVSNDVIVGRITAPGPIAYTGKTPGATDTTMIQFKTAHSGVKLA